jgi:hypothetical protein
MASLTLMFAYISNFTDNESVNFAYFLCGSGISNSPESRSKEATGVTVLSEDKRTGEPNIVNAPLSYVKVAEYSLFPTVTFHEVGWRA